MDDTLLLDYSFTSTPNPIRASAEGANPVTIDLLVMINPPGDSVMIQSIKIQIPCGQQNVGSDLSANPNLPQPDYDRNIAWTITTSGDTVTIQPAAPGSKGAPVESTIVFTLLSITVNITPGTVPLTITEQPPLPTLPRTNDQAYTLVKLPNDTPVTAFGTPTPILTQQGQQVLLGWACSDAGQQLNFELAYCDETGSWASGTCLSGGDCLTWQEGAKGILSPAINHTTTFWLYAIEADALGHRSIVQALQTTVEVLMPQISQNIEALPYFSGRYASLHWLALDAIYCQIELDGAVVVQSAPVDTYDQGYLLKIGEPGATHQLAVTAFDQYGNQAYQSFPNITVDAVGSITANTGLKQIAITPDGALALATESSPSTVQVIDLASMALDPKPIAVGAGPAAIAITPDSAKALVSNIGDPSSPGTVTIIDIVQRTALPNPIPVGTAPMAIAITHDAAWALVSNFGDRSITIIDIAQASVAGTLQTAYGFGRLALTPDSMYALALNMGVEPNPGTATLIDIAQQAIRPNPIPIEGGPLSIAIAPSGAYALIGTLQSGVQKLDLTSYQIEGSPIVDNSIVAESINFTSDGALALLTCSLNQELLIVDMSTNDTQQIPLNFLPESVAITPDGAHALVVNSGQSAITVI